MNFRFFQNTTQWLLVSLWGLSVSALCLAQDVSPEVDRVERAVWRKVPIAVPLIVGEERLVHFPDSVSVGLPQSLTAVLRSQSINGTVYLLAQQPFAPTRVLVRSESDGLIYVLDIAAEPDSAGLQALADLQIMLPASPTPEPENSASAASGHPRPASGGYVALTRFAAQQLYAPTRLLPSRKGIVSMPVRQEPVALVMGGEVDAVPVASWKVGGRYVTAVKLTNRSNRSVVLDPRELRGSWLAATFQHNRLLAAGREADTTAVYLVSERPFEATL